MNTTIKCPNQNQPLLVVAWAIDSMNRHSIKANIIYRILIMSPDYYGNLSIILWTFNSLVTKMTEHKSEAVAFFLLLFFGAFGFHRFYLGMRRLWNSFSLGDIPGGVFWLIFNMLTCYCFYIFFFLFDLISLSSMIQEYNSKVDHKENMRRTTLALGKFWVKKFISM